MANSERDRKSAPRGRNGRHALLGAVGIVLGGVFLWLAMPHVDPAEVATALRQLDGKWLSAGIVVYLAAIALRDSPNRPRRAEWRRGRRDDL